MQIKAGGVDSDGLASYILQIPFPEGKVSVDDAERRARRGASAVEDAVEGVHPASVVRGPRSGGVGWGGDGALGGCSEGWGGVGKRWWRIGAQSPWGRCEGLSLGKARPPYSCCVSWVFYTMLIPISFRVYFSICE